MPRLTETERISMMNAHEAHWEEANTIAASPIEVLPGPGDGRTAPPYGLPEFRAQKTAYHTLSETVGRLSEMDLPLLRTQRDAIFGTSAEDQNGIWSKLMLYKPLVKVRLGNQHPLSKIVPNMGRALPGRYVEITHSFIDHWTRVNAALGDEPLVIGNFTLAMLQASHNSLMTKIQEIASAETGDLALRREEREQLFGDVAESERLETSIISHLLQYHATILSRFAGQPLANTLPRIFPSQSNAPLPTFAYNFATTNNVLSIWLRVPDVDERVTLFLKEGTLEQSQPLPTAAPDTVVSTTWNNITVVDDIDTVEIRDGDGRTVARGVRDTDLTAPSNP